MNKGYINSLLEIIVSCRGEWTTQIIREGNYEVEYKCSYMGIDFTFNESTVLEDTYKIELVRIGDNGFEKWTLEHGIDYHELNVKKVD